MKFLDFKETAEKLDWLTILDWLNQPYKETKTEIKTETAVINKKNKLFFYKADGAQPGKALGIINFVADHKQLDPRSACELLIKEFLRTPDPPKREIPNLSLEYGPEVQALGLSEETAQNFEIGICKQRSIMAKKIAFKLYDQSGNHAGYIGKEVKKDGWFYPKGLKRSFLYNGNRANGDYCILVPSALDCALLHQLGFPFSLSLLGLSPTKEQVQALIRFRRILLIHPDPHNTILKLAPQSFVKAITYQITADTTPDKIKSFF